MNAEEQLNTLIKKENKKSKNDEVGVMEDMDGSLDQLDQFENMLKYTINTGDEEEYDMDEDILPNQIPQGDDINFVDDDDDYLEKDPLGILLHNKDFKSHNGMVSKIKEVNIPENKFAKTDTPLIVNAVKKKKEGI